MDRNTFFDNLRKYKDNSLTHHGIKGQKWGERRYQNEDGTWTDLGKERRRSSQWKHDLVEQQLNINVKNGKFARPQENANKELEKKKGEKIYHITPNEFNNLREGQDLYVSATDNDRDTYKSFLSLMLMHKGYGKDIPLKEVEFTLKEDLKSPSNDIQKEIFNEVYNKNKKVFDKDLNEYYSTRTKIPKDVYDAYIKALDGVNMKSKTKFYNVLKHAGYNAVLDTHDVTGSWMFAERPLIIMDAVNTLGDIKISDISNSDIIQSLKNLDIL